MIHPPTSLKPAEHTRTIYSHVVQKGNDYKKDVLNPCYWVHMCAKLIPGDRIEVMGPAGEYFADLYVATVNPLGARVLPLSFVSIEADTVEADAEQAADDFDIKFRGPQKWSIIRVADSKVIKELIPTRDEAMRDLLDYRKALAA